MCYCCQKLEICWFSRNQPQMCESASNVQLSDWLSQISTNQTAVHLRPIRTSEADSIHLRLICTFEADSLYIWGRLNLFSHVICLSQSDSCTFEAESVWASNVQHRIGLKCTELASNVWTLPGKGIQSLGQSRWFHGRSHSLAQERCDSGPRIGRPCPVESDRPQMYSCLSIYPIGLKFEADFSKADRQMRSDVP